MNVDFFFTDEREPAVKKICDACPVEEQCLEFAIVMNCTGFFGGMTSEQRRQYREGADETI